MIFGFRHLAPRARRQIADLEPGEHDAPQLRHLVPDRVEQPPNLAVLALDQVHDEMGFAS